MSDEACDGIASKIKGGPIDILVNNVRNDKGRKFFLQ